MSEAASDDGEHVFGCIVWFGQRHIRNAIFDMIEDAFDWANDQTTTWDKRRKGRPSPATRVPSRMTLWKMPAHNPKPGEGEWVCKLATFPFVLPAE